MKQNIRNSKNTNTKNVCKKIISTAIIIIASLTGFSQENYTIKMSMKMEGLPPEYASMGEMDITTYIKGEKTRIDISSMMVNGTTVSDGKVQTSVMETMGNKIGYTTTKEEIDVYVKKEKMSGKSKIEYTNEKKTIEGYECTKAIMRIATKEKQEMEMTVWVTDKMKVNMKNSASVSAYGGMNMEELNGYPLEIRMTSSQGGMEITMVYTATEVKVENSLDDSLFVLDTNGYKMISYKDFLKTGQGR
ncbi:MAG: hypothetical protein KF900_05405 [Bacteroidetes bacterium]|nr:hypothetical protein [Bacteroidota bacterium]